MLTAANMKPFTDSSSIVNDAPALQARARADGYLYFRELLPRQAVLDVRRDFTDMLADIGWLKAGTDPDDCIVGRDSTVEGQEEYYPAFLRFQQMHRFHKLSTHPALMAMYDTLFGEPTLAHPRNIGRIMFPDAPATPPHQDYLHIRGTPETWTAWIPLGDLPLKMGGLCILPGSHTLELLPTKAMPGAGGAGIDDPRLNATWLTGDFKAGDVLTFHSHCIHASLPNQTPDRMRLSVDYRYQPMSEPVDTRSIQPHFGRFGWDYVYATWPQGTEADQYYWHDKPLNIVDSFAELAAKGGY